MQPSLSLAVLTGRGCRYTAESDELVVTKNNLVKLVGKRNHINNLMELSQNLPHCALATITLDDMNLTDDTDDKYLVTALTRTSPSPGSLTWWHLRLNHKDPEAIKRMATDKSALGLEITVDD